MKKILSTLTFVICQLSFSLAQGVQFENNDFLNASVYDCWVDGPFRQGKIEGNIMVMDNPYKDETNPSDKVLALQRSKFGSNQFGARIDLKETFQLETATKYVHVLIHKPKAGRSMLVGLGKHTSWSEQTNDVEQFWETSSTENKVGEWYDAVFPIKGNGGIDIYSLVVIPDCESTHALTEDFFCYIDNIVVSGSSTSRTNKVDYALNFPKTQANTHASRKISAVTFSASSQANQTLEINGSLLYSDNTLKTLLVKPGDVVKTSFSPNITWMGGYAYADWNNDGIYDYSLSSNGLDKELLAYSQYGGHDSDGNSVDGSTLYCPDFTVPVTLNHGFYRMRYKVDWDCIDPAGNNDPSNYIYQNGGMITDFMVNVHSDKVTVNNNDLNGDVTLSDGTPLKDYQQDFNKGFTIKINPYEGFYCEKLKIYHGYNLDGEQYIHGNKQWTALSLTSSQIEKGIFEVPASWVDGNIKIVATFQKTEGIKDLSAISIDNKSYYNLAGQPVDGNYKGVAICNDKKVLREMPINSAGEWNSQGRIEVICGSMFSGKSEELIRRIKRAQFARQRVEVFKPAIDTRYSEDDVVSHNHNAIPSTPVDSSMSILLLSSEIDVVGIDEAQFFDDGLIEVCNELANRGVRVIVAGLDMDFKGIPFGPMPALCAIADDVQKVHAICVKCGSLAYVSHRLVKNDRRVLLGETLEYEPLCRECFKKEIENSERDTDPQP